VTSSLFKFQMLISASLGTKHHSMHFTVEDGLNALSDVIYHIESYDVTTIRASTPMFLLSRKIKAMGVKMVLSGEGIESFIFTGKVANESKGSDEILGGYLYFHNAPSASALHAETITKVKNLYLADNLRANKSTMAVCTLVKGSSSER
jgi:asparagine synthase (glutamine-hydrolysing)